MDTTDTRPNVDDDTLTAEDRAAIERALAVAEGLGVARFNQAEATFNWDEPRNRPTPPIDIGDEERDRGEQTKRRRPDDRGAASSRDRHANCFSIRISCHIWPCQ